MLITESARGVAMRRVEAQAGRFPDFDLETNEARAPGPGSAPGLDERDARLAMAIEQLVARRWLTLAAVLDRCLARPGSWSALDPAVKAALLCGAAQMLLMDRIPDHAAINESVEWVKQHRKTSRGAGGLVNAVLRRISRMRGEGSPAAAQSEGFGGFEGLPRAGILLGDGRVRGLTEEAFSEDAITRAVQQCSVPRGLLERWVSQFGEKAALEIAMHGLVEAPVIVAGVKNSETLTPALSLGERGAEKNPHPDPLPEYRERAIGLEAHAVKGFFVFTGDHAALEEFLALNPGARVQDPSSAAAVEMIRGMVGNPSIIVDYCAGRGTKTRQLSQVLPPAKIIASDVNGTRLAELRDASAGDARIEAVSMNELSRFRGQADLLVLDVPCSNTGVLSRRVEAKYRFSRESLDSLVKLQREIVMKSLPLLRAPAPAPGGAPGPGFVLYSTCSLEPHENEQQVEWMTREMGMEVVKMESRRPRGLPGEPLTRYQDGSFAALLKLRKAGE